MEEDAVVVPAAMLVKIKSSSPAGATAIVDDDASIVNGGIAAKSKSCCHHTKDLILYDSTSQLNQAFYFNQFGRSILFISFMFLSLGVLQLANRQAGCPQNDNGTYINCGNQVYGMLPSSMLSLMAIIGSVSTSCFMPYAGAVVDFSDHRLTFGMVNALLLTLTNCAQIFIFENTWFAMVLLHSVVTSATFMANSMVLWSYVSAPTDHDLHGVMSSGRIWETGGMLGFFIIVGAVQFGSGWDSVNIARFSQALATGVGGTSLFLAYRRYEPVKAVKTLPKKDDGSNMNLYLAGLRELKTTLVTIHVTDPPAARFLIGSTFVEASIASFTNLAISYLSAQIEMTATEITIFILVNLAANPIGIVLHRSLARRVGHKRSYVGCQAYTLLITPLMIGVVHSPAQTNLAFLFSVLFGISFGWYFPSSNGYFVSLVPEEKVSELWGLNSLCSVILSWVPPILFAVLNETTGNIRVGWIGVIIFELIGLVISWTIPETKSVDVGTMGDIVDEEKCSSSIEEKTILDEHPLTIS